MSKQDNKTRGGRKGNIESERWKRRGRRRRRQISLELPKAFLFESKAIRFTMICSIFCDNHLYMPHLK